MKMRLPAPSPLKAVFPLKPLLAAVCVVGLVACSSAPPPPDWQMGAKGSLVRATEAGLRG